MTRLIVSFILVSAVTAGCGGDRKSATGDADSLAVAGGDTTLGGGLHGGDADTNDTLAATPVDTTGTVYRGWVVFQPGRASFTACGSTERSWVVDLSGRVLSDVYDRLAFNSGDPVFFELRGRLDPPPQTGFGAEFANQLTVFAVRRAALEGPACNENLHAIEFRARGNEPFWSLDIGPAGIAFSDFGRSMKLTFPYAEPEVTADEWHYRSTIDNEESHEITITIRVSECTDSMSGAYFTFVAAAEIDGRAYDGCAMQGW